MNAGPRDAREARCEMSENNTPSGEVLSRRLDGGVLRLTKTNPESAYGISLAMWRALGEAIDTARTDDSIRAVVIDAAGRGFHRGAVMVTELKPALADLDRADFRDLVQRGQALGRAIATLPKPVIGVAAGGALGGGLELLLRCDFLYTTDAAEFSFPEVTLGFVAAWGGTQWGGRMLAFRRAQEMLLLGEPIDGRRAAEIDLVTRSFATPEQLAAHVDVVLERLRCCSPASFAQTKHCLAAVWAGPLEYGERIELEAEAEAMASGDFLKALPHLGRGRAFDFVSGGVVDAARKYRVD